MFCPRCGIDNESTQGYCRQCGQLLSDVRLAMQGAASESLAKLKSAAHVMNGGIATVAVFTLIAVFITLIGALSGHPVLGTIGMINSLLGVLIGLPLVLVGKMRVRQAARLLSGPETRALDTERRNGAITSGLQSDFNRLAPGSVTENTTLNLKTRRKG